LGRLYTSYDEGTMTICPFTGRVVSPKDKSEEGNEYKYR
jgi:hypothetical protein